MPIHNLWINDRYKITSSVASGGSSRVYQAIDYGDPQQPMVIVKLLGTGIRSEDDPSMEFFSREVSALRMLSHQSIVQLIDYGHSTAHDAPYLVLEYIDGSRTLEEHVTTWGPEVIDCIDFLIQLFGAVLYAHGLHVVHRDLNPKNILIDRSGNPKIIDFGVSKILGTMNAGKTVGEFFTRPYASPEQVQGEAVGYESDIYSLAAVFYYMLTRKHPDAATPLVDQFAQLSGLHPQVRDVAARMAAPSPLNRYQTASAASRDLDAALDTLRVESRRFCLALTDNAIGNLYDETLIDSRQFAKAEVMLREALLGGTHIVRTEEQGDNGDAETAKCYLITEAVSLHCAVELDSLRRRNGRLVVIAAKSFPSYVLEKMRTQGFSVSAEWRIANARDPQPAGITDIGDLIAEAENFFYHSDLQKKRLERRKELVSAWLDVLMVDRDLREKNLLQIAYSSWEALHGNTVLKLNVTATDEQIGCLTVGQALAMTSAKNVRRQLAVGTYLQYDGKCLYISKQPSCNLSRLARAGRVSEDEAQWRASWIRQKDALDKIVSRECVNPHLPDILIDPSQTRAFSVQPVERLYSHELDESRLDAISAALSTRDLYLIQGPPGTGKTMVISELVAQILTREPKAKILLVSQSHVAVDHALAKVTELLPGCRVARLGREENISRTAQAHTLDNKLGSWVADIRSKTQFYLESRLSELRSSASLGNELELADEIRAMIRRKDLTDADEQIIAGMQLLMDHAKERELLPTTKCLDGLMDELLQERAPQYFEVKKILAEWTKRIGRTDDFSEPYLSACSLVAGTCVGIAGQRYLPDRFDWAIVDEAGHATPSEILIPMVRAERCILVGDHKQLPPVVDHILRSELAKRESVDTTWLDRSLFEHLFEHVPDSAKTVLRKQFRMHPYIARLVSDVFYPYDQLSSGVEPEDRICPWERWSSPVIWYSTSEMADRGEEWDEATRSRYNLREVRIIEEQLKSLENELPASDEPVTVGVISGYAAQAQLLSRRLGVNDDGRWRKISIEINTVDAFQGRDRDIVFYSVVRSNPERKIGHLEDCRRLNVALSRARRLLFVVGDREMVELATTRETNPFRQVLAHIREHPGECMLLEGIDGTA